MKMTKESVVHLKSGNIITISDYNEIVSEIVKIWTRQIVYRMILAHDFSKNDQRLIFEDEAGREMIEKLRKELFSHIDLLELLEGIIHSDHDGYSDGAKAVFKEIFGVDF